MSDSPAQMGSRRAREVLGLSAIHTPADLRRAFREAAKRAHPDRPGGDPELFREAVEAFRVLQVGAAQPRQIFAPATVSQRSADTNLLSIEPLVALGGGPVEHALPDGRRLRLTLPPGLRTGDTVRAGETELKVVIRGDGEVMVRGDDLWMTVKVDPRLLAEGGRVAVDTPFGRRVVWITRKAAERGLVRLVGQGLPARGPWTEGHLFLRLAPVERKVDSAARTLLRRFTAAWAA